MGGKGYYSHNVTKFFSPYMEAIGIKADKTAFHSLRHGMQLGVHAARPRETVPRTVFWPSDCDRSDGPFDRRVPLFGRRLVAERGTFREVASIITVFGTVASDARLSILRAKTPLSLHRFQRLQRVFGGPYSLGAHPATASHCD